MVTGRLATGEGALSVLPKEEGNVELGSKPLNAESRCCSLSITLWWLPFCIGKTNGECACLEKKKKLRYTERNREFWMFSKL